METWVLRCKLYPEATPWRNNRLARPFRGGGWILRVIAGLDRWLSKQNPAYRPDRNKKAPLTRCFLIMPSPLGRVPHRGGRGLFFSSSVICLFLANATFPRGEGLLSTSVKPSFYVTVLTPFCIGLIFFLTENTVPCAVSVSFCLRYINVNFYRNFLNNLLVITL